METTDYQLGSTQDKPKPRKDYTELGLDFFADILQSIVKDVIATDNEWLERCIQNQHLLNDGGGPLPSMEECLTISGIGSHPTTHFPEVSQPKVFQQARGGLCGFHAFHNAKCFIKAILSKDKRERLINILSFASMPKFWSHYEKTLKILVACTNHYYVNKSDKKGLVAEAEPLERSHLRYLLMKDQEVTNIQSNEKDCKVYMELYLFAYGLLQQSIDQMKTLDSQIQEFRESPKETVFCLFLGVVNHWTTFIAHKEKSSQEIKFYYLDSQNLQFLDKVDEQLPDVMEQRSRQKQNIGMKPMSTWSKKVSIQSIFDQRRTLQMLVDAFSGKFKLSQFFTNASTHKILKHFHMYMQPFNPTSEICLPKSRMLAQIKTITQEEEKSLSLFDIEEFRFPYKRLSGHCAILGSEETDEELLNLFDILIMFLLACHRPQHIEADILRQLNAFGVQSFFKEDLEILASWCDCLLGINQKFSTRPLLLKDKEERHLVLFEDLMQVARKLRNKLLKFRGQSQCCYVANF